MSHISSFALPVKAVSRTFHRTFLPIYVRENSCTPLTTTYMNSKAIFCWLVNESWRTKYEDESYIIRVHKHLWEIVQLWNKFLKQKGQHKWFQKKIKIPVYRKFSIFTTDSRLNSSDPWKCAQLFARNSQAKNTMPLLARGNIRRTPMNFNLYFIDSCCACSTLWVSLKIGDTQQCK